MGDYRTNLPLANGINALFSGFANGAIVKKQRQWADEDFEKRVAMLGIEAAQKEKLSQKQFEQKKALAKTENKSTKDPFQDSIADVYNSALKDNKAGNSDNLFSALMEYGKGAEDPQARKVFMQLENSDLNKFYNGNLKGLSLEEINKLEKEAQEYINMGIGLSTNEFDWARGEVQNEEVKKKEEIKKKKDHLKLQNNLIYSNPSNQYIQM